MKSDSLLLATVVDWVNDTFIIQCENKKRYSIIPSDNFTSQLLEESFENSLLFYFDTNQGKAVFLDEEIQADEDYEIPEERDDLNG